jgi:hypothetical protein
MTFEKRKTLMQSRMHIAADWNKPGYPMSGYAGAPLFAVRTLNNDTTQG